MSKTRASCFIRGSNQLETIKALGLRPRAFICFSVFGTPDETLALVFDIFTSQRSGQGENFFTLNFCLDVNDIFITENWPGKELFRPKLFGRNNQTNFLTNFVL